MRRDSADDENATDERRSFRISVRLLAEDKGNIDHSTSKDFRYDALDADVRLTVNGRSPLPSGAHRVSGDGFVHAVPVIDFLWHLAAAVIRLTFDETQHESVSLTSTDYRLDFVNHDGLVTLRILEETSDGGFSLHAETNVQLGELIQACTRAAELTLLAITNSNPELEGNADLQRFAAIIRRLRGSG